MGCIAAILVFVGVWWVGIVMGAGAGKLSSAEGVLFLFWYMIPVIPGVAAYAVYSAIEKARADATSAASAEKARQAQEQASRIQAERQRRIDALCASGELIPCPTEARVTCANGHHYKYKEFVIEDKHVNTEYLPMSDAVWGQKGEYLGTRRWEQQYVYTDVSRRFGCPLCKTALATFDDERLRPYRECSKCHYWYHMRRDSCPLCD